MGSFDIALQIARGQRGLAEHSQLIAAGVPRGTITYWLSAGRITRAQPRVYSFGTVKASWEQDVQAAVLSSGGAACLRSAARLWGLLPGANAVEVLVARGVSARLNNTTVHWTARELETAIRRGIRTTTPLPTLAMLGGVAPRDDVADAASRALASRLVSTAGLEAAVERFGGPGSRGPRLLRSILREWELGKRPNDSVLETRMATLRRRFKLPRSEFQFKVKNEDGRDLGRVDFAYPADRLAIEVDGGEHHSPAQDRQRDARRRNALSIAGWTVLVFTWSDVVSAGHDVAAAILAQLKTCRGEIGNPISARQDRGQLRVGGGEAMAAEAVEERVPVR